MLKLYLVPIEIVSTGANTEARGPKYLVWKYDPDPPGIACNFGMMMYGFTPYALVAALDITQIDHDALILHSDVFAFPDNLDASVSDPNIDTFFETIHVPTDWLTPSTSYRELLRQTAGMIQFNQRYGGIYGERYGGWHSLFDTATLDTRLSQLATQEREIFLATVQSFGYDPSLIPTNARLRQLVKQAGSYWEGQPFYIGGYKF